MKELTLPTRMFAFVNHVLDNLLADGGAAAALDPARPPARQPRQERRELLFYKQLIDAETQQVIGQLADLGVGGFKLDCQNPLPVNKDFRLSMNLSSDLADKPAMLFVARSRWCQPHPSAPDCYSVGFQLVLISAADREILARLQERYGAAQRSPRMSESW